MSDAMHGSGAARLLDRAAPSGYVREWTERIAAARHDTVLGTVSVLIFRIGPEWLALPTALFQEVAEGGAWHSLPHRPATPGAGLVNIRGELLITIALGAVLGIEAPFAVAGRRLLVARQGRARFVFPVDEAAAVYRYSPGELRPLPATLDEQRAAHSRGLLYWREKMVGCLDETLLFRTLSKGLA